MGGRWIFGLVLLVMMGCTRADRPEASAPPVVEREVIHENCPAPAEPIKCDSTNDMIDIKTKCFKAIEIRESTIEELRRQIIRLHEEVTTAKSDAQDWRDRYNNQPRQTCDYDGY